MKIEIKRIKDAMGVYSLQPILQGEVIFQVTYMQQLNRPTRYSLQVGIQKHIDFAQEDLSMTNTSFFWRFLNHSCEANIVFDASELTFRALRDIAVGEQLCFNYLLNEYDMATPFKCTCGASQCFKQIKGFRYLTDQQKEQLLPMANEHIRLLYMREAVLG